MVLFLGVFIFLLNINFVSSICYIETSASTCTNNGNNIVVRLSDSTNAHGGLATQSNYDNVLCCEEGTGSLTCSGTNKVIGLASVTNSHAERPELTNYINNVCYDGLANCGFVNSTLASNEREVIGLSSDTNAHLGGFNDYKSITNNRRIVCTAVSSPASCDLTSALWETTTTSEGNSIDMIVDGTPECGDVGVEISFEVLQGSTVIATPAPVAFAAGNTQVNGTWTNVGPAGTYTFRATVVANPSETQTSSNSLLVNAVPPWCTDGVPPDPVLCSDYTNENDCESNICGVDVDSSSFGGTGVDCDAPGTNCDCGWDAGSCGPSVTYNGARCGDNIIQASNNEQCDGTEWGPITSCSNFTLTSGTGLICNPPGTPNECQFNTSSPYCTGTAGPCGNNVINPGETCDGIFSPSVNSCNDLDDFTGGDLSCVGCQIDTTQCTGGSSSNDAGTCHYTQDTIDNCDDGFLTLTWITSWEWDPGCTGSCQTQNQALMNQCIADNGLVDSLACPAQIPLPFFTFYNLLAALVVIAFVYWVIEVRKSRKKGKQ